MDATHKRESIEKLVLEVLDGAPVRLTVDSLQLKEDFESGKVKSECLVHDIKTGESATIQGEGVGIIDAFFHGLVDRYSDEYPSLKTIRFADFALKSDASAWNDSARSDMAVNVLLRIANSEDREFEFQHSSPSLSRSSIYVVLKAVEFFINSEKSFISVYRALQHARTENRVDSVRRYTAQLATLVEATSYSEVIQTIRDELGKS